MIKENSGKIFRFKLDFNMGFGYAEQVDFSDVHTFDGILILVYKLIDDSIVERSIDEIRKSGILFGPVSIFRYPPQRGKGAWKLLCIASDFIINELPPIKFMSGSKPIKDWSKTKGQWYKYTNWKADPIKVNYEDVRYIETSTLNSSTGIVSKITMMKIIQSGERVSNYYDLTDLGYKNIYIQIVNTYYDKDTAEKLLLIVDEF